MSSFHGGFEHIREMAITREIIEDLRLRGIDKPKNPLQGGARERVFMLEVFKDPRTIRLTWERWLESSDVADRNKEILVQALTRMTLGDGPDKTYGYCGTVNNLIDRACDGLEINSTRLCSVIFKLERFGFRFPNTSSLLAFARRAHGLLRDFEDAIRVSEESIYSPKTQSLMMFIVGLASDRAVAGKHPEDACLPEDHGDYGLLILSMEMFLSIPGMRSLFDMVVIEDTSFNLNGIWDLLCKSMELGLDEARIRRALTREDAPWGIHFLSTFVRSGGKRSVYLVCMMEPDLLINSGDIVSLAENWDRAGKPCEPLKFAEIGGTVELWQTHKLEAEIRLATDRSKKKPAPRVPAITSRPDQTPKGTKRHHPNFRAPREESTVIDFGAMCDELDVHVCLPGLNADFVRAVLVHGLLREGDRLASISTSPKRNDRKLWSQVKDHVPQASRKKLVRALRPLLDAHLISFQGGNYQLAKPSPRFPEARVLLTQLRGAVARHSS
jgi:hypothetical protein